MLIEVMFFYLLKHHTKRSWSQKITVDINSVINGHVVLYESMTYLAGLGTTRFTSQLHEYCQCVSQSIGYRD